MDIIKIEDMSFRYNSRAQTLKNINLKIKKDSWVSIIGHNGSGKSTLAKLLVGLLKANSGTIKVEDIVLDEKSVSDVRRKIGIVFQNPDNQFVGVSVKHDIAFGLENRQIESSIIRETVLKFSQKVGMNQYLEKSPGDLSGGQKQRMAIAGVLAVEPRIIIFDESTSMLDPEGTKDIVEMLKILKTEKTLVTITHDLNIASLSDWVVVMDQGQIILEGKPADVFKETEKLKQASLELPLGLKVIEEIKKSSILKDNPKAGELLWQLNSKI
ncbi:MAG: energy-coupling factor transporter ATPase [Erysipelotrichales bacterium]|nr:energy-coupling factor transporter ATPase [Erysipelotrichales bacterium]